MRNLLETLAWTVALIGMVCLATAALATDNTNFPPNTWESWLADFDRRQSAYNGTDPVIIGPSYAVMLGETPFSNLGLLSARYPEICLIADKYCSDSERIIYLTSIRDIRNVHYAPRYAIRYLHLCRIALVRAGIRYSLLRIQEEPDVRSSGPLAGVGYLGNIKSLDMSIYDRFYARHSNTIFILHPMPPLPDTRQGRKLAGLMRLYRQWFKDSGLPHLDLTDQFPLEQFDTILHLKEPALAEMRDMIKYALRT